MLTTPIIAGIGIACLLIAVVCFGLAVLFAADPEGRRDSVALSLLGAAVVAALAYACFACWVLLRVFSG